MYTLVGNTAIISKDVISNPTEAAKLLKKYVINDGTGYKYVYKKAQ